MLMKSGANLTGTLPMNSLIKTNLTIKTN